MDKFRDKKVAVLGFGTEGESAARFLASKGATVSVFDIRQKDLFDEGKIAELEQIGISFQFEGFPKSFQEYSSVVRSPGIRLSSSVIERAKKEGKEITSAIKIFFDLCSAKIIGITGTKGKGTTSSLIYEMLKKQGYDAYLGGNIGTSPLDFLDKLKIDSWAVLELSSFQLQDLTKSPQISVFLMVTSEHLDYHRDVNEYVNAKRNILKFQKPSDFAVINLDYEASGASDNHTEAQVYYVSREQEVERGCYYRDGSIWLKTGSVAPHLHSASSPTLRTLDEGHPVAPPVREIKIIDVKEILIPGRHNYENACAASMAACLAGVSLENTAAVLREFKGLEHRLELARTIGGVSYYDDSFSTTPETAIAAIEAFSAPEILILGGSSKNSDFTELGKTISEAQNIKTIIGIGEEWPRIKRELGDMNYELRIIEGCSSMKEIVEKASEIAEVGDVVLLSPACASFDMFSNYKERGNEFKREVEKLS